MASKQERQISVLLARREKLFASVQRTYDAFKTLQVANVMSHKSRYDKLDSLEAEFDVLQNEMIVVNSQLDEGIDALPVNTVQASFEDLVYATRTQYISILDQRPTVVSEIPSHVASSALNSLPTIQLPQFSGDMSNWPDFYALFTSLVHDNQSLNNVQRFHYLRSSLKDAALSTISSFQISADNYPMAYNALTTRYQNKRLLASLYVQQVLDFTPLKSSTHAKLQHFLQVHRNSVDALKALDIPDLSDFLLLSLALSNLDQQTRKSFEAKHSSFSTPTYKQLITFLDETSKTLELCCFDQPSPSSFKVQSTAQSQRKVNSLFVAKANSNESRKLTPVSHSPSQSSNACPLCKGPHSLYMCPSFLHQSVPEKYATLTQLRRCFSCMGFHAQSECKSQNSCWTCRSSRHHTLLHPVNAGAPSVTATLATADSCSPNAGPVAPRVLSCHLKSTPSLHRVALLGTVRALIQDAVGQYHPFRAVIDSGSQVSAITLSLAQGLGLKVHPSHTELSGIGQVITKVHGNVHCNVASRVNPQCKLSVQALVLSAISSNLPTASVPVQVFNKYRGLSLADDAFHLPDQIDFLIGADLYPEILSRNGDVVIGGNPSAINTVFGWVILGSIPASGLESPAPCSLFVCSTVSLDSTLRQFWESEEISFPPQKNPDDQLCEDHFMATHSRDVEGRYSVALPFKPQCSPLGSTRKVAFQSFLSLERRLRSSPEHDTAYRKFMQEYVDLGHMQPAVTSADYVIPHHCVHKVSSSSTKLRVVFNASAPDPRGVSLNQQLLVGPKLQQDLPSILLRFRTHPIAICADIRQMYRQIRILPDDRAHQHIFWRPTPDSPVGEYQLNTVTYGLAPSAYLAQRVLHQIVNDDGAPFPLASRAITSQTYIDDIVTGAQTLPQALALQSELQQLLSQGGFELRKWTSNLPEALAALPKDHLETPLVFSSEELGIKILGLMWDPLSDSFSFRALPFNGPLTKRTALSYIARIFDPLGFISPFVSWLKIFLQRLWLSQLQWDDSLSEELASSWHSAVADVTQLVKFRVPRPFPALHSVFRIVGFCDASEKGYAAVLYLHATVESSFQVSLLRARSKVAPVKTLTIPKLELSAALLLTRLLKSTQSALIDLNVNSIVLYSDSTIVLAWLATPPHRLKTFVANRVVEILEHSSPSEWAHVLSAENPADCASRGLSASELLEHPLWQCGPSFLQAPFEAWPRHTRATETASLPELKPPSVLVVRAEVAVDPLLIRFETFSTLLRAQRVFGYVIRFARLLLAKHSKTPTPPTGPLQPVELQDALDFFVKITQRHYFAAEFRQLTKLGQVSSSIASLKPFVGSSGAIKVGGRLRYSSLPEEARYPVLLPKAAHLSKLLCDNAHKISLHSGPRTVQALIQQQYWIVSLRGLLRQRIHRCLTCHKFRAKPLQPLMADLPAARVQQSRAFTHVGTDFAGPFMVKFSLRRNAPSVKGYLCLFVCMATKAVHLELVSEMSTVAFLACFDRFLSRRGLPAHVYSDCGRNYVGAARHLREMLDLLRHSEPAVTNALAARGVLWTFNPPYAPNFGGLWEAGVKSAKSLLHRLISDTPHTFEEYATIFCRIEAVLNSRPLCALASEPEESSSYLSPGHFLVGSPLLAPPEPVEVDRPSRLSRWQRVRQLHQSFWMRWHSEYLHTLMQRGKWLRGCPNLKVGDVVFFRDSSSSPLSWPIGRVCDLLPGRDGVVRVVSVRTTHGTFTRPVNQLVVLPLV